MCLRGLSQIWVRDSEFTSSVFPTYLMFVQCLPKLDLSISVHIPVPYHVTKSLKPIFFTLAKGWEHFWISNLLNEHSNLTILGKVVCLRKVRDLPSHLAQESGLNFRLLLLLFYCVLLIIQGFFFYDVSVSRWM
jgi:hypothetical protein